MSRKADLFRTVIAYPMTVYQFLAIIQGSPQVSMLIESATYPSVKLGEVAIPFKGEFIYRPTRVESDKTWRIRVPDNLLFTIRRELVANHATVYDHSGVFEGRKNITFLMINSSMIPVPAFTLKGAWIKGRDAVNLDTSDVTDVFKWNVEIKFAAIVENELLNKRATQQFHGLNEGIG